MHLNQSGINIYILQIWSNIRNFKHLKIKDWQLWRVHFNLKYTRVLAMFLQCIFNRYDFIFEKCNWSYVGKISIEYFSFISWIGYYIISIFQNDIMGIFLSLISEKGAMVSQNVLSFLLRNKVEPIHGIMSNSLCDILTLTETKQVARFIQFNIKSMHYIVKIEMLMGGGGA